MLEIIFTILSALVCGFYLYVLLQFRQESMRTGRKPESLTYLGSNKRPTILFPVKGEKRSGAGGASRGEKKLAPVSKRPAAKAAETTSRGAEKLNRLPYLEVMLPVTAVVTPLNIRRDARHIHIPERQQHRYQKAEMAAQSMRYYSQVPHHMEDCAPKKTPPKLGA
jgi:hypothetical protein